jgi:predicted DCC family thiol-disulfide oxidoreductase YuxK
MTKRRTILGLLGLGELGWGVLRARLTFGAVPSRLTLLFDGSCDFCTRAVRLVRAIDRRGKITLVPFQKPGEPERHGLTVAQCEQSIWAVTPDGFTFHAAAAANLTLAVALGVPLPLWLYAIPGVDAFQEAVYRFVARTRSLIPGDTPYCEQHPAECGRSGAGA